MNLNETAQLLGNLGEFLGAIAVVATLVYLAAQIRQNTRTMRSTAHHSANQLGVQINLALGTNAEAAQVLLNGSAEVPFDTPHQQLMFHFLMRANFSGAEDFYIQVREGLLEANMWESRRVSMLRYLEQPGVRSWWEDNQGIFSDDFAAELTRDG
jgi:hypothetical protein